MASVQSDSDVRSERIQKMGPELGNLFHLLCNEHISLQLEWQEFVELYGTSPERTDLLNQSACYFFGSLQSILFEHALLGLARLTDPIQTSNKFNLTILKLPEFMTNAEDKMAAKTLVDAAKKASLFARDWRHRHIAHHDLSLALGHAHPLEPASRKSVKEALANIAKVLNFVHQKYFPNSELGLDHVMAPHFGAMSLLCILRDGVEAEAARKHRFASGCPLPTDFMRPRAI